MNKEVRVELEAIRRYRILEYARETGNVVATCRDLGIPRSSFYRWKRAFEMPSELGNLAILQTLHLNSNQLIGPIPTELGNLANLHFMILSFNQLTNHVPLAVAQLGGLIQNTYGPSNCDFLPGNAGLYFPDSQDYRDADLDGDGYICEVAVPPGTLPAVFPTKVTWPDSRRPRF